ncbi:MAG: tRNA pseudouridine(55) synthase TruB [Bacilli bacterium]|jgi:tRNA pseudouridine55 synthase
MVGIFLLDKQSHWTSHDVVNKLKQRFHQRKIGHTGTLDPLATGLLIVTLGGATKLMPYLNELPKTYEAILKLGEKTSSLDAETPVIARQFVPELDQKTIETAMDSFLGEYRQTPPLTSALKFEGEPLYRKAHRGEKVKVKSRIVIIEELILQDYDAVNKRLKFSVTCSSGTYIRTLGADLAGQLGTIGYLQSLRRTAIGQFHVDDAKRVDEVTPEDLLPIAKALYFIPLVPYDEKNAAAALNGRAIKLQNLDHPRVLIPDCEGKIIAIYQRVNHHLYRCLRGLR